MYYLHKKTGVIYETVAVCVIEATNSSGIIYQSVDGGEDVSPTLWMRPAAEFFDGRFEPYHGLSFNLTHSDAQEMMAADNAEWSSDAGVDNTFKDSEANITEDFNDPSPNKGATLSAQIPGEYFRTTREDNV